MNLEALLSELRVNVLRDDAQKAIGPEDQLWSDETLVLYLNDAQQRFARKTLTLRDASTPDVTQVTLATGVSSYPLNNVVLAVVSARYDTSVVDLPRSGHTLIYGGAREPDPPWFDPSIVTQWPPGPPMIFNTDETMVFDDEGAVTFNVFPAPSATENGKIISMRVARLPLDDFAIAKLQANCEIPSDYQLDMIEWAAYRAFRTSDIDGHSAMAVDCKTRFEDAVQDVLKDVRRKMFAPTTWKFGQNGFTWS